MNQIKEGDLVRVSDFRRIFNGRVGIVVCYELRAQYWEGYRSEQSLVGWHVFVNNRLVWCEEKRLLNLSDGQ